ncbi:MAG TPA: SET domain-containing protein-lysine N-methyltransferase [Spirochaetia bacterium]|nr:SET domain-containing protein-lysine N-methyltransferase [Spirochaetia bacterium]
MRPKHDLVIKRTPVGLGLFTRNPIRKGAFVIEYTGVRVPNSDESRLKGRYLFEVNSRWTIDGSGRENLSRYINHSCRPNCEAIISRGRILIYAKRAIAPDEELAYDYGKAYFDEFIKPKGCGCAHCRTQAASASSPG